MPVLLPSTAPLLGPCVRVGLLGTYPPKLCGIATFTAALEAELIRSAHEVTTVVVTDGDQPAGQAQRSDMLINGRSDSVRRAARTLSRCDVAIVQHEYGIYGGPDGEEITEVLRQIECPTIVVLHTVPSKPSAGQKTVLEAICESATCVIVMTSAASTRLSNVYRCDEEKIAVIPHGAWEPSRFQHDSRYRRSGRLELLTWGLLGPGKGIEHMIDAMSLLTDIASHVRYTVAGATHPKVFARDGDQYRQALLQQTWSSGAQRLVRFDDSYRDIASLARLVESSSMVVLPYDSHDQVTSGVLVDAVAAGRPVIATEFPHAVELLSGGAGRLVPHADPVALATAIRETLADPFALDDMSDRAAEIAPSLSWRHVAARYIELWRTIDSGTSGWVDACSLTSLR